MVTTCTEAGYVSPSRYVPISRDNRPIPGAQISYLAVRPRCVDGDPAPVVFAGSLFLKADDYRTFFEDPGIRFVIPEDDQLFVRDAPCQTRRGIRCLPGADHSFLAGRELREGDVDPRYAEAFVESLTDRWEGTPFRRSEAYRRQPVIAHGALEAGAHILAAPVEVGVNFWGQVRSDNGSVPSASACAYVRSTVENMVTFGASGCYPMTSGADAPTVEFSAGLPLSRP